MQKVTINVPDGYEVQVVRKEDKKEPVIRTYQDLTDNSKCVSGYYIDKFSNICYIAGPAFKESRNTAISEKVAKSMLAMAMISQLMPYYGEEITEEEWSNTHISKYVIYKRNNTIYINEHTTIYTFLSFHSPKQRDEFLKYNEQLVKDYLMID